MGEIGVVFTHPDSTKNPHNTKGGVAGSVTLALPEETERLTVVLGRTQDDATTAVAFWNALATRLNLADVVVRTLDAAPGFHPTRCGALVDRASGAVLGYVGEVDTELVHVLAPTATNRRLGLIDIDLAALSDHSKATRTSQFVNVPSRYPSAVIDLAFVTPVSVHAQDLAHALRSASTFVERVELFDVYRGTNLPEGTRSLAYSVRFSSNEATLSDTEVSSARDALIATAVSLGAVLR